MKKKCVLSSGHRNIIKFQFLLTSYLDFKFKRQVYNLFQDLWNRYPFLGGWGWVHSPFGATAKQKDRYTDRTGGRWKHSSPFGAKGKQTDRQD